ncbi:alpha/beta hydrolase [Agrobacterium tumefaciens]|uniref:Acetylxylan esterase n=1 Tax=Agrobacterium tumefaciens TaxID=358 RepID=A0AA44F628_AGRTU|nr:alpha/beta hydrolase [Agrobacterium tumefaciens]NSL21315.1 acetylxylan esterase [Agrobacterium tumefaciens]NTB83887.1 acetylxylan esterase [Agrobacterium tumefaciens]NTC20644.1 acetylxylan esterase [Agrobacterium tumefaciens]NTC29358.1 acetylxylan esterase [Agrobacterium tumefaciens]NTC57854.1 acetylxylan esterase [Agrobacterium tumefaciens]
MVTREDVEFEVEGGDLIRAWLYKPEVSGSLLPAITMAHGYAGVRQHGLERFASAFAEAGFMVLLHDHRGFGASEGQPRQDVDPWRQISDWRRAITFLENIEGVDPNRIGIWGTSYAGGHVLVLGATDRRIKAVVSQVPTISGFEQGLRRISPENVPMIERLFDDDERAQFRGDEPRSQLIVSSDLSVPASYRAKDAIDFYLQPLPEGVWENRVTVRSTRAARMYEPGNWISRVSPTPLMVVVALNDTITVTDLALTAYERALAPKALVTIQGGHFDPYLSQFETSSTAAIDWFTKHL